MLDHCILDDAALLARRLGGELHAVRACVPMAIVAAATAGAPPMTVSAQELAIERGAEPEDVRALVSDYGIDLQRARPTSDDAEGVMRWDECGRKMRRSAHVRVLLRTCLR